MAIGPGKYDSFAIRVREETKARGVMLIVFGGEHGNGFSSQLPLEEMLLVPTILRSVADQIERDGPRATGMGTT